MGDKIGNSIALHQQTINELKKIKDRVENTRADNIRLSIETKHWIGYSEPFLSKCKDRFKISIYAMNLILDEAISKEEERINKLIDMEIEERSENSKC